MKLKNVCGIIAAFGLASVSVVNIYAQAPKYNVTFLDIQGEFPTTYALNKKGEIAGYYITGSEIVSFLYSNGILTTLGSLGGYDSEAFGINNKGKIVGFSENSAGLAHAFLYSDQQMMDLGTLAGSGGSSVAYAINDLGQIVGYSTAPNASSTAVVFWEGKVIPLGSLNETSPYSWAHDINNNYTGSSTGLPDIIGNAFFNTTNQCCYGFLYSKGEVIDIGNKVCTPNGFGYSEVSSINDVGQIIGLCALNSQASTTTAFLYDHASENYNFIKIGYSTVAYSINNKGQVVGSYDTFLPFLYTNGEIYPLFDLIPPTSLASINTITINDEGQIVATTNKGIVLFTPLKEE